jgi:hypothetical protein
LELSIVDASSGRYLGDMSDNHLKQLKSSTDFMKTIIKQNIQNQMYFEELGLSEIFRLREYSRYLFLDFLADFSLILVANQGAYDLHLFRLVNCLNPEEGTSKYKLLREYVFKAHSPGVRILGVSVQRPSPACNRVYVLGSDRRMNVVEIRRREGEM